MKKIKLFVAALLVASTGFFTSCDDTQQKDETVVETPEPTAENREDAVEDKRDELNDVYDDYIDIKDALYKNDADEVRNQVGEMKKALDNFRSSDMAPADIEQWNTMATEFRKHLDNMQAAKTIAEQRTHFKPLSDHMVKAVKQMGLEDKDAFVMNCPMKEGGNWVSKDKDVKNPYFGDKDKMASCGSVKETLTANDGIDKTGDGAGHSEHDGHNH